MRQNWASSSSPFHLRNFYIFCVMPLAVSSAEKCTLCRGGTQITRPEKRLDFQGRLEIYNCSVLDEFASSLDADSEECSDLQRIGSICGCFMNGTGCGLCPDGSAVTNLEKRLPYPEDILGDLVPPTCAFFEAALTQITTSSNECKEIQLINTLCGCPIPEDACIFCPHAIISTPQKDVSDVFHLTGIPTTCETVEAFIYSSIKSGTSDCGETELFNYFCGCDGGGHKRLALLAWLPRISAVLSILGSSFIMQHILKDKKRRKAPYHQLVLGMSHFDLLSSIWWSLTTLPMPEVHESGYYNYVYGAKGTYASCKAQGFFIQLGFTSPFFNMSLALYYLLVVTFGWSEVKIKKIILWMHAVPILSGLGLAFGGIPFYGPGGAPSFCYIEDELNHRNSVIFLVVPISIAIVFATSAMAVLFWSVYRREKASSRWASKERSQLSRKVFWQAFWYLTSFYISWPVLIAVIFVDGDLYTGYWFLCLSMFLAPIQGFLNFIVYIRPRAQHFMDKKTCSSCVLLSSFSSKLMQATPNSTAEHENEVTGADINEPCAANTKLYAGSVAPIEEGCTLETSAIEKKTAKDSGERPCADVWVDLSSIREPSTVAC